MSTKFSKILKDFLKCTEQIRGVQSNFSGSFKGADDLRSSNKRAMQQCISCNAVRLFLVYVWMTRMRTIR